MKARREKKIHFGPFAHELFWPCSQLASDKGIQIPESRNFIWRNPESWVLKSEIQLKESGISLTIEIRLIQVPMTKSPGSSTWNPAIHGVESRNQDLLGFSYIGRSSNLSSPGLFPQSPGDEVGDPAERPFHKLLACVASVSNRVTA